ncbi:uncharacterized protein SCHCODRAFT_02602651 [Schizophyllum commune H4-8]|uniref:uncharacterized protein n=1 Tax=Schizophyllum commune (strain H4-8 / FGSC 9210) TaxID=578458 RepID=UPI00215E8679|nr:uncharacterized protein SCHCODRAFT_02602651 [Schizophyllum commune H4-8]KAI5886921.1 hypothetical protein SCHCODRAFT_02602651 [Schizophyllum commune H4-8]
MEDSAALALAQSLSVLIGEFSPSPGSQTHHNSRMNTFLRLFGRYTRSKAWKRVKPPRRYTSYSCWRCLRSHRVGHASSSATTVSGTIFRALTDAAVLPSRASDQQGQQDAGEVGWDYETATFDVARKDHEGTSSTRGKWVWVSNTATRNLFNTTRGSPTARNLCFTIVSSVLDDPLNISPSKKPSTPPSSTTSTTLPPSTTPPARPQAHFSLPPSTLRERPTTSVTKPHLQPLSSDLSGTCISTGAGDVLAQCRRYTMAYDTGEEPSPTPEKRLQSQRRALFLNIDMSYVVKRADPTASTSTSIAMPLARSAPRGQRVALRSYHGELCRWTTAKATSKEEGSVGEHEDGGPGRRVGAVVKATSSEGPKARAEVKAVSDVDAGTSSYCLLCSPADYALYLLGVLRDAIASFSLAWSLHARGPSAANRAVCAFAPPFVDCGQRRSGPPSPTIGVLAFTTRQQRIPPHVTFGIGFLFAFDDASLLIFDDASVLILEDASLLIFDDAFVLAFDDASHLHPQQRIPPHRLPSALNNVVNKHVERDLAINGGGGSCSRAT